jgi:hypothetical protein
LQTDLFGEFSLEGYQKQMQLATIVDVLNWLFGRETLFFALQGTPGSAPGNHGPSVARSGPLRAGKN